MLNPRQKNILELVVREFVETGEPVASAIITEKFDIGCCSATVRNDMAKLEEMGYLEQPHTSSGRIPKDKAYRFFVNEIVRRKIAIPPQITARIIKKEYQIIQMQLELILERTARLLSEITHYTSMLLAPRLRKSLFRYLKLVSLGPSAVLLIMMTNTGFIIHRTIEVSKPMVPLDLERITNLLNERLLGSAMEILEPILNDIPPDEVSNEVVEGIREVSQSLLDDYGRAVFLGGRKHLLDVVEFKDIGRIKVLMELLEDEKVVAEILCCSLKEDGIQVLIGEENPIDELKECSVVTATYAIDGMPVGTLGIIGPKRMPYETIIPIVNFTAENFSSKLRKLDQL